MADPITWTSQCQVVTDIGTAGSTRFTAPSAGYLRRIQVMLHGAITVAAENISYQINNGTSSGTVITLATGGSAEGTVGTAEVYTGVNKGDLIEIVNDGASTGPTAATITVTLSK